VTSSYNLQVKRSAEKELRKVHRVDLSRIVKKIQALAKNPRPQGSQKLSAEENYRIRQGDWRIVYTIDEKNKTVEVVKIGHRREIYR